MGRPPLAPGSWGAIRHYALADGRSRARGRYRASDGAYHSLEATAPTFAEAERRLRLKAAGSRGGVWLSPESTVEQLARWWLAGLRSRGRKLQVGTIENYDFDSRRVVRAMGRLRLIELDVRVVDAVIFQLADTDTANAKRVHGTLRRMVDEAVRVGVMASNPVDAVPTPWVATARPYALTIAQAQQVRELFRNWQTTRVKPGPRPDPRMADMVDTMLATGLRIGELLALRQCDVRLDAHPPTLFVAATLVDDEKGAPVWQDHLKAERQTRSLILPQLAVQALRQYLTAPGSDRPVFPNRNGNWLRPGNVRRVLNSFREECREALESAGIHPELLTPHLFRRTVATAIAHRIGIDRAKEQLGRASISTTERHYVTPPRVVGAQAVAIIDEIFAAPSRTGVEKLRLDGES